MPHPADPLRALQAAAALASAWPTLHVFGPDEGAVEGARHRLEAALGPLPQADLIEPWDDAEDDPRWELRVDLPELGAEDWHRIEALDLGDAALVPGVREGVRAADDQGLRICELLEADGLRAVLHIDDEGVLTPDLARAGGGDEAIAALETELSHAVRAVDPAVGFRSDRGPDTVATVVHRSTGRFGIQLAFDEDTFAGLDGDAVLARRRALLAAVGTVVRGRAEHPRVRLAPDLLWDVPLGGLVLTLWIVAPAVPGLPGDEELPESSWPREEALAALASDPSQVEDLELHVVPVGPEAHDAVVERVTERLSEAGAPVLGGLPRWLRHRGRWMFCPVWRVLAADAAELPRIVELARVAGVVAVRVVPGEPAGLGDAWSCAVPSWTWGALRCLVRVRDGLTDRDRLPETGPRARTPRDAEVELAAFAALVASEDPAGLLPGAPGPGRAIVDSEGRPGVEFAFDRKSFGEAALRSTLRAIAAVGHPEVAPVAWYAHRHDRTLIRLWYRVSAKDQGPVWR